MLIDKLKQYADKLLDLSSRNRLINFKDTKVSTAELLYPNVDEFFNYIINSDTPIEFNIINKKDELSKKNEEDYDNDAIVDTTIEKRNKKEKLLTIYEKFLYKQKSILFYNGIDTYSAIKGISKKSLEYFVETGNNITYLCFGFLKWKESENSKVEFNSPLLLIKCRLVKEESKDYYKIIIEENDVIINSTLKYKLKNELDINLPEYNDQELEIYLSMVNKITQKCYGTIIKECKISNNSFLRLNMFEDIKKNLEAIINNPIVAKLLGSNEVLINNDINESFKTTSYNPIIDLHNVVDADSSQIEAIEKAKSGASFVLQGPPGTGKSQTITNIIAECLFDNKKVLFVSEKLAALNIVYNNLSEAGLGEFCLELHSQKTNKTEFLKELCETIRKEKVTVSNKVNDYESIHEECIKNLDKYEKEFYIEYEIINKNLRELYSEYYKYREIPDIIYYNNRFVESDEKWILSQRDIVREVLNYTNRFNLDIKENLWYGINLDDKDISRIATELKSDLDILTLFFETKNKLSKRYNLQIFEISDLKLILKLKEVIEKTDLKIKECINIEEFINLDNVIKKVIKCKNRIKQNEEYIKANYNECISNICSKKEKDYLVNECNIWFKRLFNGEYHRIKRKYKQIFINGKTSYNTIIYAIERWEEYNADFKNFTTLIEKENLVSRLLGDFCDINSDLDKIERFLSSIIEVKKLFNMTKNYSFEKSYIEFVDENFDTIDRLLNYEFITTKYIDYKKKFNLFLNDTDIVATINKLYQNVNDIPEWKMFTEAYSLVKKVGLLDFIIMCKKENISNEVIPNELLKCFYKQWIDYIFESNRYLRNFDRLMHDELISNFDNTDNIKYKINRSRIKERLSNNRPDMNFVDINANSAVSNILKEGAKKRKQKSIKDVIEENGEFIQKIKPCFLMSPLSVSTFLSGNAIKFDVVIFDEASQIFPEDSICSIYRGKQVIIVGDSKQMPPSNFFVSDFEVDDSIDGDVGSFESILDVSSAILPEIKLSWHYRSRNESLIAFSNKYFYDNKLVTFKSAKSDCDDFGVDFEYVPSAIYSKGKNLIEAKKVVDKIFEHFDKYKNSRSLGVIAFGIKQQEAIENELEKRLEQNPKYKEYCSISDKNEPFFIKNLETVQGDERDTIIFSIGYGYDEQGRFLLNFGPLSRKGGERRLNVAATRAKYNVKVISSIRGNEINIRQITSEGGNLLSSYLQYAEYGKIILEKDVKVDSFDTFDSEFEMDVCDYLRKNGYDVDTQVGSSGYRIDMAVKRPNSSDYYLAIECDGATYHSSKNARDRDRLRQKVLENLGWKFYRIWSTDWFLHNKNEKEQLLTYLKECKDIKKEKISKVDKLNIEINSNKNNNIFKNYKFSYAKYNNNFYEFLYQVLEDEAPLNEEWFLKRYVYIFGREKVTSVVRKNYNEIMERCSQYGIIRKEGYLYIRNKNIEFRTQGIEKRSFEYISEAELASGMFVIIKNNLNMTKESLFKQICHLQECSTTEFNILKLQDAVKYLTKIKSKSIKLNNENIEYNESK